MRILFSGGSSFTGYWFIRELALSGHSVTAVFQKEREDYSGLRKNRVSMLAPYCRQIFSCPFGKNPFLDLLSSQTWDLYCHHAAMVENYKSPAFPVLSAVDNNTYNGDKVAQLLASGGSRAIVLTGSVFEQREGRGSDPLQAVSPYGLSKGITADVFSYFTAKSGLACKKFVIPNPFGPYEAFRFPSYLIGEWMQGREAVVHCPEYIRDNIPVTLLARAYAAFVENEDMHQAPSGYVGSQGEFTARFAEEMRPRLGLPCRFRLESQKEFTEPLKRINPSPCDPTLYHWDESEFWDLAADYYREQAEKS